MSKLVYNPWFERHWSILWKTPVYGVGSFNTGSPWKHEHLVYTYFALDAYVFIYRLGPYMYYFRPWRHTRIHIKFERKKNLFLEENRFLFTKGLLEIVSYITVNCPRNNSILFALCKTTFKSFSVTILIFIETQHWD